MPNFEGLAWATGADMTTDVSQMRKAGRRHGLSHKVSEEAGNMIEDIRQEFMAKVRESMSGKKITLDTVNKALQVTDDAKSLLKNVSNWSFNIF